MKKIALVLAVFVFPVLTIAYFMLNGATVALVYNAGKQDTLVSMVIASAGSFERTTDKVLISKRSTLIMFFPRTEGDLSVTCTKEGHWRGFPLGHDSPKHFLASIITLDACDGLLRHGGFSF